MEIIDALPTFCADCKKPNLIKGSFLKTKLDFVFDEDLCHEMFCGWLCAFLWYSANHSVLRRRCIPGIYSFILLLIFLQESNRMNKYMLKKRRIE